ncbi:MAG: putative Ig domain-containing protein [Gammaproteobacteria bacterium]
MNDAPEVIAALTDQVIDEDALFSFVLPADTFSDPDLVHGDEITTTAALIGGDPLPVWLNFDASTGTFAGTPDNSDVGELIIQVVATDIAEESASDTFTLTINNVNDAPILVTGIKDQVIDENQLFSLTIPDATFTDEDSIHGDTLSLNAALSGGNALPEWLSFDPVTGTFTGIPSFADYGEIDIQVSAVDLGGLIASDIFSLGVNVPGATIGSEGDDMLSGSNQHDTLIGFGGNDTINGGNGNDRLAGGTGDDALEGGNGRDILYGGTGNDHLSGSNSNDELFGGAGNDLLYGGNGNDLLDGGDGNDFLYGENSKDILTGGMGDDYLDGGNGSDELFGGSGDDLLHGRNGSDLLDGGAGNDFLYGDNGNDTYIFNHGYGHDHVVDDNGNDQLFLGDINHDQLWVWQSGQDLNLGVIGTDDKVTIQDWFEHNKHQVEEIHSANEQVLHKNQVDMLVQAMATFNPEATGNLDVPVHDQEQAEAVIAAAWQ